MATDNEKIALDNEENESSAINIKDLLMISLHYWYWYVISVIVCLGLGFYYLLRTPKSYAVTAELLVKENTKGMNSSTDFGSFDNFDMFMSKSNIHNEMATISSPDLMAEVVKRLNLNITYSVPGRFHNTVIYGSNQPITAYFSGAPADTTVSFTVSLLPDSTVMLKDIRKHKTEYEDLKLDGRLTSAIETPIGDITILPTAAYDSLIRVEEPVDIHVTRVPEKAARRYFLSELSISQPEEKSSVINLTINDVNIERGTAIINTLILVYNKKWVDDRNQISVSTSNFIDDRLNVIQGELGDVDNEISAYKSANLVPDVNTASSMYLQQATQANNEILSLNNQLEMANMVRNHLTSPDKKFQLLPVNTGFESPSISAQVTNYNQKVLDRNSLIANSSDRNPLIIDIDKSLEDMRSAIVSSIDNQIEAIRGQLRTQKKREGQAISQISSNPQQAKYLLSVERQQMVKESLYLFLLQKREENELSQAFTAYNNRIIMQPQSSGLPTSPNKRNVLIISFLLGLMIPAAVIYIRQLLNTKVRGRKDLANLNVPYIGELPQYKDSSIKTTLKDRLLARRPDAGEGVIVVKEGSRDVINEAFRVIRANLEFMSDKTAKVIAVTSANPGSGKTFITFNLAAVLALKGRKVLVIDLDLRKGSLTKYLGASEAKHAKGFTDYIIGREDDYYSLIHKDVKGSRVDVMPMGTMPPNPTELLYSDKFVSLIDDLRNNYDVIFLDCPPVEVVADAAIINKVCDMTLFVIRAGLFEREMLNEVQHFYDSGKYKNLSIILNGTSREPGRYGYGYGYGYGYDSGKGIESK